MTTIKRLPKLAMLSGIGVIFLALILQFGACKDDIAWSDDNTYIIAGHLYTDCNLEPVANKKIRLEVIHPNGTYYSNYDMTVETTTDANGYYKFEFKNKRDFPLEISCQAGTGYKTLMSDIPARISLDDLSLHMLSSTNIKVMLNVLNPYSANDTLFITDLRNNKYTPFPGPFSSGPLYTASNFPLNEEYYSGEQRAITWYLNHFNGVSHEKWFVIDKFCRDTVTVTVDIF